LLGSSKSDIVVEQAVVVSDGGVGLKKVIMLMHKKAFVKLLEMMV
jgi:hypothetical protein